MRLAILPVGLLVGLLHFTASLSAQRRFDVTPLFGLRTPISTEVSAENQPGAKASIAADTSLGAAVGVRYEETAVIEFRFTRQNTHTTLTGTTPPASGPLATRLEQYHGDFTREFIPENASRIRPFLIGSLGVTRLAWPTQSTSRLSFGIGGGVKFFPLKWLGFRAQAQWLPVWLNPQVKALACGAGCTVVLGGKLADQAEISFGPIFSF